MIKYFICVTFFLSVLSDITFGQGNRKFDQLPASTQNGFRQITAKYHSGKVEYSTIENDLKNSGIDFSKMSVEDAVMMMFMLISEDARKDLKDMLNDMEATRKKRSALREAETLMKKELDSLRNQARNKYDAYSNNNTVKLTEKETLLEQNRKQQKEVLDAENKNIILKNAAEMHLQSVEDAMNKLRQQQSLKKTQ